MTITFQLPCLLDANYAKHKHLKYYYQTEKSLNLVED